MPATLQNILGENGSVARRLGDRYEFRPQQLEMASSVERAFKEGHHLLVEAGTGVGKSFAYLLPAIDYAVRTKKRVVISYTYDCKAPGTAYRKGHSPPCRAVYHR